MGDAEDALAKKERIRKLAAQKLAAGMSYAFRLKTVRHRRSPLFVSPPYYRRLTLHFSICALQRKRRPVTAVRTSRIWRTVW
jgi:hypothetical protein